MNKEKVYFKSISIENFRCFGPKQRINFYKPGSNEVSRWNVILGENGVGKTSILRALALTLVTPEKGHEWRNEIPWKSFGRYKAKSNPSLNYEAIAGTQEQLKFGFEIFRSELVTKGYDDQLKKFDDGLVLFAYGASRRIGSKGITSKDEFSARSIFRENVELMNAEEWLVQADYLALKDSRYKHLAKLVLSSIKQMMQDEVKDVKIDVDLHNRPSVNFQTSYGWVPLHELSLGYKTFLAWMVDFAKGMIDRYPSSKNPLNEPAICLIDEVDLHLHPKLQRDIVNFLLTTFEQTQFIVSSHSPLIVQSTKDVNLILLKKVKDHVEVENNPVRINNWRIDQILVSDLFGLNSSRGPEAESLLSERKSLLSKRKLTPTDESKLKAIEDKLGHLPTWDSTSEQKAMNAIDKIAQMIERKENNDQG
jgi:predicted ATP-dependent endonuclease of OLD family